MSWKARSISASTLAAEYVVGAHDFFEKVVNLCTRLHESATERGDVRQQAACAALWAVMVTATESSSLSEGDRKTLLPLVLKAYLPYWEKHCGPRTPPHECYARYLQRRDPDSHLRTAVAIVESLFEVLNAPATTRSSFSRMFSALFAHRILNDVQYFNEIKANYTIVV